jgi:hypothetical protein
MVGWASAPDGADNPLNMYGFLVVERMLMDEIR